jgi:hypothetical protein
MSVTKEQFLAGFKAVDRYYGENGVGNTGQNDWAIAELKASRGESPFSAEEIAAMGGANQYKEVLFFGSSRFYDFPGADNDLLTTAEADEGFQTVINI